MKEMTTCKTCDKAVAFSAKVCPNCGANLKNKSLLKKILVGLGVLIIIIFIISSYEQSSINSTAIPTAPSSNYTNPMSWAAFQATQPKSPVRMKLYAKLGDYFNYNFRGTQDTYWSIQFEDETKWPTAITGYVRKDSTDGHSLFNLLQDGQAHPVILDIYYPLIVESSDLVLIEKFASQGWVIN